MREYTSLPFVIALDDLRSLNDHTIAQITERRCSELIIFRPHSNTERSFIHSTTIPLHTIYIRNTINPIGTRRERTDLESRRGELGYGLQVNVDGRTTKVDQPVLRYGTE